MTISLHWKKSMRHCPLHTHTHTLWKCEILFSSELDQLFNFTGKKHTNMTGRTGTCVFPDSSQRPGSYTSLLEQQTGYIGNEILACFLWTTYCICTLYTTVKARVHLTFCLGVYFSDLFLRFRVTQERENKTFLGNHGV